MKINRTRRSALGACAIMAFALAVPAHASDALRAAIEAANTQLLAAVKRRDAAGVADFFTADAQVMAPDSDPIKGRDAIQRFVQQLIDTGVAGAQNNIFEVYGCGPYDACQRASVIPRPRFQGRTAPCDSFERRTRSVGHSIL